MVGARGAEPAGGAREVGAELAGQRVRKVGCLVASCDDHGRKLVSVRQMHAAGDGADEERGGAKARSVFFEGGFSDQRSPAWMVTWGGES